MDIDKLDALSIMSDEVIDSVYGEPDIIERSRLIAKLKLRAKALGIKQSYDKFIKDIEKAIKEQEKEELSNKRRHVTDSFTDFGFNEVEYNVPGYIADKKGIFAIKEYADVLVCYHPIFIAEILNNAETGKEKVKLVYWKSGKWKEIIVDKATIASASKIVSLAEYGVSVTSETAKGLVDFLACIENYNQDIIERHTSISHFGWVGNKFIPYDSDITFDSQSRFRDLFDSVKEYGDFETWLELVKAIRQSGRYEPTACMSASFASVLMKPLNALPFILNIWGKTGGGKSVALILASSIWAKPTLEGGFISDPTTTRAAFEAREGILSNLPMMIDDFSRQKDKYKDTFTDFIYAICAGKSKERSNIDLGLREAITWQNACISNMERPLSEEVTRGGAINRILDCEADYGDIFKNGNKVVKVLSNNYGFAGKLFIEAVRKIGFDEIRLIQEDFLSKIEEIAKAHGTEKEDKQTLPLSVVLTADKIATDEIFKDGIYLDIEKMVGFLKNKGEVDENRKAYEFIQGEIAINQNRFKPEAGFEAWGIIEDGYAIILKNKFDEIAEHGNFSSRAFLGWAAREGLIQSQDSHNTKKKRIGETNARCVFLKLESEDPEPEGFRPALPDEIPYE